MVAIAPLASVAEAFYQPCSEVDRIEAGIPLETLTQFVRDSGLAWNELYDVVIPARTLKHRRSRSESLSRDESDKFARVMRIFDQALQTFGSIDNARSWLTQPKQRFAGRTPLEVARTDVGGRLVEEMLGQIDTGYFA